jgi:hypothetical protein
MSYANRSLSFGLATVFDLAVFTIVVFDSELRSKNASQGCENERHACGKVSHCCESLSNAWLELSQTCET